MYLTNDVHNLFYAKISEVTYREHSGIRCDIHICGKNSQHLIDRQLKGSALFSQSTGYLAGGLSLSRSPLDSQLS